MTLRNQACLLTIVLLSACAGRHVEVAADRGPSGKVAVLTMVLRSEILRHQEKWLVADAESFARVAGLDSAALTGIAAGLEGIGAVGAPTREADCAESSRPCVGLFLKFYRENGDLIELYLNLRTPPPRSPCADTNGYHFYLSRHGRKVRLDLTAWDHGSMGSDCRP